MASEPASRILDIIRVEFPIPYKSGETEKLHMLNWLNSPFIPNENPTFENVHDFVVSRFQAYGKSVERDGVQKKLKNTEEFLVHCLETLRNYKTKTNPN